MRTYLHQLRERLDAPRTAYFRALEGGTLSRADFVETQVQFFGAVAYFARPMMALASRLPRVEQRLALVANIADEHGSGDLSRSHERTFLELLSRLGVPEEAARATPLGPEVTAFNATLIGVCTAEDPDLAIATLAIIEDLFATLSALIGRAVVARGWLTPGELVHYATHEVLDLEHGEAFYRLIEPRWADHAPTIRRGLELGGYAFVRLYDDLHRATRPRVGPRDTKAPVDGRTATR